MKDEKLFEGNKMEMEEVNWHEDVSMDLFEMPLGHRGGLLEESRGYNASGFVTNTKMLEASIALDELLLKLKKFSRPGNGN